MESQPQNSEFRNNPEIILKAFTHVLYVYLHSVDGKVTVPVGLIVGKIVSVCV